MRPASLLAFACTFALVAQEVPKDFPYLSKMPNYELLAGDCDDKEFDAYKFFNGKKWVTVEGKFWARAYYLKEGATAASNLQIFRNYANAIKAAGGTAFFQGVPPEGGEYYSCYDIFCGKLQKGGKEVWVLVNPCNGGNDYMLYAIEAEAMKQDVAAKELLDALNKDGFVALDVQFDTSKTTIKPESHGLLDQVVAMLKGDGALKLSIEGHTDNTGVAAENQKISEGRAKSVLDYLTSKGVDAARLSSAGFGASKPAADNRTTEGKAKNRRVELVKR